MLLPRLYKQAPSPWLVREALRPPLSALPQQGKAQLTELDDDEVERLIATSCPRCAGLPATQAAIHGEPWFRGKFCGCNF